MNDTTVWPDRIDAALVADEVLLTNEVLLTVDYGQSLQQMIAAGHYDRTNPDITAARFPITGTGIQSVVAKLFHFDRNISSEYVVEAIRTADAARPWAPAAVEHLMSFGATRPDEQRKYPIAAFGSVSLVRGDRQMPRLFRGGIGRVLDLSWWDGGWSDRCRFLAVRNLSSGA